MKKLIIFATFLFLQGCASNFLVNQAGDALHYEAIVQLSQKEVIDQRAYVGGQVATIDRSKRQIELVKRHINSSGYPEEGSNNLSQRIFITFTPDTRINFFDISVGDRMAVIGKIIDLQKAEIAGNDMTILQVQVSGDNYRTWSNYNSRWDDDRFYWGPYNSRYWRYRPWYY
ncbi:Slp family lipoprotein [Wohlfahrtiimonas larvae]|uniref:Slp family lipoprotein n=1 Tax=Wohlfahrtiimonas larvae TaxID=1157986 RepID=A0ABP9MVL0_9GAMM|nr:Slp family lipoprotein [Wohlfahrtiimonas larvae]